MDKDVYRRDLGDLIPVYQEVYNRLSELTEEKSEYDVFRKSICNL